MFGSKSVQPISGVGSDMDPGQSVRISNFGSVLSGLVKGGKKLMGMEKSGIVLLNHEKNGKYNSIHN